MAGSTGLIVRRPTVYCIRCGAEQLVERGLRACACGSAAFVTGIRPTWTVTHNDKHLLLKRLGIASE